MSRGRSGSRRLAPRADVALLAGYHSPQVDVAVRLNTNEAPELPPEAFVRDLQEAVGAIEMNRYPDREARALREAIAAQHGVGPEHVYCANGSNEVLQSLLLAYGGPGRSVAVFEPTYALHSHIARVTGTGVIEGERDEEMLIDERELARVLTLGGRAGEENPVVTFVCSPNNPTGRAEPRDSVERVLAAAPGLVVVDEAYAQFAPWSATELLADHPHLVVVRTFSKTWSLAALRLGYAIADPEVVDALWRVTLPYHLDSVKQAAGVLALRHRDAVAERTARLVEERGRLSAALRSLGMDVYPSDANFVLFRTTGHDARGVWRSLLARSVLVRDVSSWPRLEGCLRVTVGNRMENDSFLVALRSALG
ncbi:MAG: histidinol-phosphate transaminase [Actinomycetota bacterium]|nr:histidinol-phosphate transaminase [Actinomycetota bacterium]